MLAQVQCVETPYSSLAVYIKRLNTLSLVLGLDRVTDRMESVCSGLFEVGNSVKVGACNQSYKSAFGSGCSCLWALSLLFHIVCGVRHTCLASVHIHEVAERASFPTTQRFPVATAK